MYRYIFPLVLSLLLVGCKSHELVVQHEPDVPSAPPVVKNRYVSDLVRLVPAEPVVKEIPRTIASRLDSLLADSLLDYAQVAIYVYDMTADSAVFDHGRHQRMRPASTQKVLTAIAALRLLGANHSLSTSLYVEGTQSGSVLQGDLCVKGGFNPLLGKSDLQAFADALLAKGIRKVSGNLKLDMSFKDTLEAGSGWCWDDENPSLSPLLYGGKDVFAVEFRKVLRQKGISLGGEDVLAEASETARLLRTRRTSLKQILVPMMKQSDNQMAEAMFYQIAALSGKRWATAEDAVRRINGFIRSELQLDPAQYKVADGCGLSPYNFTTPAFMVELLRYAYRTPSVQSHFLSSLPVAGEDGTLKKRMLETSACQNVCAKTGTLTGVSTLAGYATAANGNKLCFAIFVHGQRRGSEARAFQDKVCCILTEKP